MMKEPFVDSVHDLVADFLYLNSLETIPELDTSPIKYEDLGFDLECQGQVSNHLIRFTEHLSAHSGANQQYNLLPTSQVGPCFELLIGIASLGFDAKYYPKKKAAGFKHLILSTIRTWFYCSGTNSKNLIITADWNPQKFETLYKPIIDAYCYRFKTEVQIYEHSTRGLYLRYPY
jgi:hypothetical protein